MKDLLKIVRKRSAPGVLIFDTEGRLLYANPEAMTMIPEPESIPEEIRALLPLNKEDGGSGIDDSSPSFAILTDKAGNTCSVRSFLIGGRREETRMFTQIMVLIEKIVEKREIDFEEVSREFGLTRREVGVLRFVSQGYSNQNISEILFISDETVKWHIKNIMRKMGACSRSEMIYLLK